LSCTSSSIFSTLLPVAVDQTTTSKEKILKKVRQALIYKSKPKFSNIDLDSNVYAQADDTSILETFARSFTDIKGQFIICDNQFDFIDKFLTLQDRKKIKNIYCREEELQVWFTDAGIGFNTPKESIDKAVATVTGCEAIIARTGSVLISSSKNSHAYTVYPPIHIVVAFASQVVMELRDSFLLIKNKYGRNLPGMLSFISGPSTTADIEKTVVIGAHGPKEVFVFLIDDLKRDGH
jgi:L-lactate dehydrogenase complex protein LldG